MVIGNDTWYHRICIALENWREQARRVYTAYYRVRRLVRIRYVSCLGIYTKIKIFKLLGTAKTITKSL